MLKYLQKRLPKFWINTNYNIKNELKIAKEKNDLNLYYELLYKSIIKDGEYAWWHT